MNPKVLLIDDDRDFCELVRRVIGDQFDVEIRHSLREGLKAAPEVRPVAILLDLVMPDSLKETVVVKVKEAVKDCALLVLSGHVDQSTQSKVIADSADGVISKDRPLRYLPMEINEAIRSKSKCSKLLRAIAHWDSP